MRPGRILHPELAKALATCGHTDIILVTDAGFPIPKDANRIDLGYYAGAVDVLDILKMLRKEIFVEEVAFATEVKTHHPALYKDLQEIYTGSGAVFKGTTHEVLVEEIAPKAKVVIRSGSLNDLQHRSICLVHRRRRDHSPGLCGAQKTHIRKRGSVFIEKRGG